MSLNIKFIFLISLVAIVFTSAEAAPKKKGDKSPCSGVCTADYTPVCAQDSSVKGSKPRTFGNKCVMDVHNCEHSAQMEVLYKGECKNSGGVRLS